MIGTQSLAPRRSALAARLRSLPPEEAAALLERAQPAEAVEALLELNPAIVQGILQHVEAPEAARVAAEPGA